MNVGRGPLFARFRLAPVRKAIFTHDLGLNVGELRCRIDLPMCAQALLSFVLEVLALWPASFGSRFAKMRIRRRASSVD